MSAATMLTRNTRKVMEVKLTDGYRSEKIALNPSDLFRVGSALIVGGLLEEVDLENVVRPDPNSDELGVVFTCDLLKAARMCDVLRKEDRRKGVRPARVYLLDRKCRKWKRIPDGENLTRQPSDSPANKRKLSPRLFRSVANS